MSPGSNTKIASVGEGENRTRGGGLGGVPFFGVVCLFVSLLNV